MLKDAEQKLEDVITSALVINESEIAESGFRSVSDLLHSLGGINVSQNGGVGLLTSIFMQGSNSNHVLVLEMVSLSMIWLQEYRPFKIYPFL